MVQKANQSMSIARRFKRNLGKNINVSHMVLFGSRAKGTFSEESDFDFLVVSDDFRQTPKHKRGTKLYSTWKEDYPLELVCLIKEELERKKKNPWGITAEALRTGITV